MSLATTDEAQTRQWTRVCHLRDIPERGGRVVHIKGMAVALFRSSHNAVLALENRCPHRGGPLSEGLLSADVVTCPLHNWRVNLVTGEALAPDKGCVHRIPVCLRGDEVFVDAGFAAPKEEARSIQDRTELHPDNKRPRIGRRRAGAEDFTIQDFDREVPVLSVEPPSPETEESLQLQITHGDKTLGPYSISELRALFEVIEFPAYLTCLMFGFSRPVSWTGVRLGDVLSHLGAPGFSHASFYSWETDKTREEQRFFETLKRDYALDPRAILAFGMNGGPLPKEHGGPLRLAVPFLQGYKSVKWLTWIKLCEHDEVGYKKLHGFIEFPEFTPPPAWRPSWEKNSHGD